MVHVKYQKMSQDLVRSMFYRKQEYAYFDLVVGWFLILRWNQAGPSLALSVSFFLSLKPNITRPENKVGDRIMTTGIIPLKNVVSGFEKFSPKACYNTSSISYIQPFHHIYKNHIDVYHTISRSNSHILNFRQ